MRKKLQFSTVVAAFMLLGIIGLPASGQTSIVPDLTAEWVAREGGPESLAAADAGVIAYVQRSTHDIHVISPDGTGDLPLWTAPEPKSPWPAYELAWRPDGGELAFSSDHEETCSYYESDIYAIRPTGTGYRRITNAPACAALAGLPKGSVTVDVSIYATPGAMVYVQGAPGAVFATFGTMTFNNVADFGPGVLQRAVGIYIGYWGEERSEGYPPYADVQPNQTVSGGSVLIPGVGISELGAGKFAWKPDGSGLAYAMRTGSRINQISANPPYGSTGEEIPVVAGTAPTLVAWGPDAAHSDLYLYFARDDGIYLNSLSDPGGGTKLVDVVAFEGETVFDIEWLPDASGFLYTKKYVYLGIWTNIFEYSFATGESTEITHLPDDNEARAFSLSPDGQQIVFEWTTEPWDPTSDLYIINRDGTGLRKLIEDAGRPAWGPTYVPEAAHAEFIATPTSGVSPLAVQFTNQSSGDYDTCTWTFGDGGTSTSCGNPTHTYATKGVYTVALTVAGPAGTNTRTRTGYITVYRPVQADFGASPTIGPPPLAVSFTNSSTGDFSSSLWDFGDGQTSTLQNPTHTYVDEGSYTVSLTVSGPGGTDTRTRPGYVVTGSTFAVWLPLVISGR
jgi:PKD repeat protein